MKKSVPDFFNIRFRAGKAGQGKAMGKDGLLWGKRDRDTGNCHPLFAHLADVASVLEALLLRPVFALRLEKALGRPLTPVLRERLCLLACLHDLGKFAPGFQLRLKDRSRGCNHLESLHWLLDQEKLLQTFPWLQDWGLSEAELFPWLLAVFSHHGTTFPFGKPPARPQSFWQPSPDFPDPWLEMTRLNEKLPEWFPLAFTAQDLEKFPPSPAAQHIFAGLLMLADWIGSDSSFFPYCGREGRAGPQEDPRPFARQAAASALKAIGLDLSAQRPFSLPSFGDQFPHALKPRPFVGVQRR